MIYFVQVLTFGVFERFFMQGNAKQRWLDVCAEAAICDDPKRLQELASQINALLREEERRLKALGPKPPTAA